MGFFAVAPLLSVVLLQLLAMICRHSACCGVFSVAAAGFAPLNTWGGVAFVASVLTAFFWSES